MYMTVCVMSVWYPPNIGCELALWWWSPLWSDKNVFAINPTFSQHVQLLEIILTPILLVKSQSLQTSSCRAVLNNPRHLPLQIALFYMPNSNQFDILWCDCYCWLNQMSIYELTARLPPGYLLPTGFNGPHVFSHLYIRIYPYIYDAMRNESYYIEQGYLQNRFGWFCF